MVYGFNNQEQYYCLESVQTTNIKSFKDKNLPWRIKTNALALMVQLNLPLYASSKNEYFKINLPKNKEDIPFGILDILKNRN